MGESISGDERKNEDEESSLTGSESFLENKTSAKQEMPTLFVSGKLCVLINTWHLSIPLITTEIKIMVS